MVVAKNRPAAVYVNLTAIKHNVAHEVKRMPTGTQLFAVVKANGYGHGAVAVAKAALAAGATGLCVAVIDEGIELRQAGIIAPILVLGITPAEKAPLAIAQDISLTVGDLAWLQAAEAKVEIGSTLKIHLAIDSGMGRIGFITKEAFIDANQFLTDNPKFEVEGMFTHFATADSADDSYFKFQVDRFNYFKSLLSVKPKYVHVANSATSIFHEACGSDLIRYGVAMYGLNPSSAPQAVDLKTPFKLEPALSVKSELVFVKKMPIKQGVSYGATYEVEPGEWIGTVPVGYADGWQRSLQGFKVKVGDSYCPIVGRICMDQFMVRLPHEMPVGTTVELIAADATAPNSIKAVADKIGTIHYEVACLLTERLPRVYQQ